MQFGTITLVRYADISDSLDQFTIELLNERIKKDVTFGRTDSSHSSVFCLSFYFNLLSYLSCQWFFVSMIIVIYYYSVRELIEAEHTQSSKFIFNIRFTHINPQLSMKNPAHIKFDEIKGELIEAATTAATGLKAAQGYVFLKLIDQLISPDMVCFVGAIRVYS